MGIRVTSKSSIFENCIRIWHAAKIRACAIHVMDTRYGEFAAAYEMRGLRVFVNEYISMITYNAIRRSYSRKNCAAPLIDVYQE